jgi:hypothetical protein
VAGQQAALQVIQAAATTARIDLDAYLRERLFSVQGALQDALQELLAQRKTELRQAVQEQERCLAAGQRELTQAREQARLRLRETEPLRARAVALTGRMDGG